MSTASTLTLYVDALVPFFNKVLYPYSPGKHITNGDSSAHSIVVPVQNVTANDVLFTPVLNDSTGLFSADMSDCDGVIKSKEGCVINVTFNAANQPITAIKSASIYLNGNVNIPLTVDFKSITSSGGGDANGGSGGSSGGSANGLMLLLLAAIKLWRSGRNFSA